MTLTRTMDAAFLNEVANHPEVRLWLGGEGVLDLTPLVAHPANVALVTEYGGWLCIKLDDGLYEAHSMFLPEGRSASLVSDMQAGFRYLFTRTDCLEVCTKVPAGNLAAKGLARAARFRETFTREDGRPHFPGPVSYQTPGTSP